MTDQTFDYSQPNKIVDGEPFLLNAEEIAAEQAKDTAWQALATVRSNNAVLEQISAIETANTMPRALRDIVLANTTSPSYAKVKAIDNEIAALRAQIVPIPSAS